MKAARSIGNNEKGSLWSINRTSIWARQISERENTRFAGHVDSLCKNPYPILPKGTNVLPMIATTQSYRTFAMLEFGIVAGSQSTSRQDTDLTSYHPPLPISTLCYPTTCVFAYHLLPFFFSADQKLYSFYYWCTWSASYFHNFWKYFSCSNCLFTKSTTSGKTKVSRPNSSIISRDYSSLPSPYCFRRSVSGGNVSWARASSLLIHTAFK